MILTLFEQFSAPIHLKVPLTTVALMVPWLLIPTRTGRWLPCRFTAIKNALVGQFASNLLLPLNRPAHKWALFFVTTLIFLIELNMLGLLPHTFTPTTQLALNAGLALPLWLTTVILGFRLNAALAIGHFVPSGSPMGLIPALIMIESISFFIRPLSLAVRITANLTAGHLILHLGAKFVLFIIPLLLPVAISGMTIVAVLMILEVAVAAIQAYVFVLLVSLYLQENS